MSSFKRKVYGRVRPVPKPKPKAPSRPEVNELKAIFRNIQKSPSWQTLDYLSEALNWWNNAIPFCQWKYKKMFPLEAAKAFNNAQMLVKSGQEAKANKEKESKFKLALQAYARYARAAVKTPDILPYLKQSKEVTKKVVATNKALAVKYDKVLTLLSQCFKSCKINLVPVDKIEVKGTSELLKRKYDHEVGKMYYSRAHCNDLKAMLHKEGIFGVVLEEAYWLSRGMAWLSSTLTRDGSFLVDQGSAFKHYRQLMKDFKEFSATTEAPKSLVRKPKKVAKKTEYKAGARALARQKEIADDKNSAL